MSDPLVNDPGKQAVGAIGANDAVRNVVAIAEIEFSEIAVKVPERIASQMRCDMNQAGLTVTPKIRCSWLLEIPISLSAIRYIACSQEFIETWLLSKIVYAYPPWTCRSLYIIIVRHDGSLGFAYEYNPTTLDEDRRRHRSSLAGNWLRRNLGLGLVWAERHLSELSRVAARG
jgi:hypothetical protein